MPCCCSLVLAAGVGGQGQDHSQRILASLDANRDRYAQVARRIWELAEVGYKETESCALLQQQLRSAGFTVQSGLAEMPTAFLATFGSGKPVIAMLAEYDALPGITQDAVPERKPIASRPSAHACGHNLFGTASVA